MGAGSIDAVYWSETKLNQLAWGKREVKGKGFGLPRRRESGVTLTVWMRRLSSADGRSEGSSWWSGIALECFTIVEVRTV